VKTDERGRIVACDRSDEPSPSTTAPRPSARPAALLAVRISPADVGRRVSVRHRYDATTLTDVVGRLVAWDDVADPAGSSPVLLVERRDGAVVPVPLAEVVAAKVVPDAPTPRTRRSH
jgi:hypothetical protein